MHAEGGLRSHDWRSAIVATAYVNEMKAVEAWLPRLDQPTGDSSGECVTAAPHLAIDLLLAVTRRGSTCP